MTYLEKTSCIYTKTCKKRKNVINWRKGNKKTSKWIDLPGMDWMKTCKKEKQKTLSTGEKGSDRNQRYKKGDAQRAFSSFGSLTHQEKPRPDEDPKRSRNVATGLTTLQSKRC